MKAFAALYQALDASTATQHKVAEMVRYLRSAPAEDAAWAVYFLAGGKPRQAVPTALLRAAAIEASRIPPWLFEECYAVVGDLAETIAYLTPDPPATSVPTGSASTTWPAGEPALSSLAQWLTQRIAPLRGLPPEEQTQRLLADWQGLQTPERFLYIKLIGGGFRVGVSRLLVQRALAEAFGLPAARVAQRMMGYTDAKQMPSAARFASLVSASEEAGRDGLQPYPFFLAHALQDDPATLGDIGGWLAEWKYDGIRAQLIRRDGQAALWSRGEELLSERFPELMALAQRLPEGTVLDGEILVWHPGAAQPAPFAQLQTRIARKRLSAAVLKQAPARFLAYDLLERAGEDLRNRPLAERRAQLEQLAAALELPVSPRVPAADWPALAAQRARARERGVEGLMLKPLDSAYGSGRSKAGGGWWKWKVDPLRVDAVLIYAQAGHGRRANVYTDYTFAVWNREPEGAGEVARVLEDIRARRPATPGALQLVAFAKAYSGLSDEEFRQVDRVIRQTTVDKFGPVRSVVPSLIFELGFEGLTRSPRHKSGVATRFPRMLRIREDKPLHEAETLPGLWEMLRGLEAGAVDGTDAGEGPAPDDSAPGSGGGSQADRQQR
ncbi:MAG: ATP-dependent DNA ligase [Rubrivivax sp.]|nr:ATP-dependent DNA ligase [Rubrivivax sp.]